MMSITNVTFNILSYRLSMFRTMIIILSCMCYCPVPCTKNFPLLYVHAVLPFIPRSFNFVASSGYRKPLVQYNFNEKIIQIIGVAK